MGPVSAAGSIKLAAGNHDELSRVAPSPVQQHCHRECDLENGDAGRHRHRSCTARWRDNLRYRPVVMVPAHDAKVHADHHDVDYPTRTQSRMVSCTHSP